MRLKKKTEATSSSSKGKGKKHKSPPENFESDNSIMIHSSSEQKNKFDSEEDSKKKDEPVREASRSPCKPQQSARSRDYSTLSYQMGVGPVIPQV